MLEDFKNLAIIAVVILAATFGLYKNWQSSPDNTKIQNSIPERPVLSPNNLVSMHSFSTGPVNAKVTVVEFFDPECEACAAVAPYIKKEVQFYKGKVNWVFRYMPYHKNSKTAIRVIEAAKRQNLFLEVQNALFESQKIWGEQQISTEKQILDVVSKVHSIDMSQIKKYMADPSIEDIINADVEEAKRSGVNGTPTFFVNGKMLEQLNLDELIRRINAGLETSTQ